VQLFHELNHRVKNNLSIASSILELQARTSPAEMRDHLRKAVDRLHSIADLHTALYQQESTETADLRPYLEDLCERLSRALLEDGRVKLVAECQPAEVLVEQAVSLGLIVNELVTNAAKHAFPDGRPGEIKVSLSASADTLHLRVSDTGRGLPPPDRAPRDGALGLRLVRSLAEGLDADLQVESGGGAAFHLRIPRRPPGSDPKVQPGLP
jgi:two-component sensor histidine kinase